MTTEQQDVRILAAVQVERMLILEWLYRERCNNVSNFTHSDTHQDGWMDAFSAIEEYIWSRTPGASRSWSVTA